MKQDKHTLSFDVVIVGAGLAGLYAAKLLSQKSFTVLLVDQKKDLSKGIHTTGIFVRKTFEDFNFSGGSLGAPVRAVTLYSPSLRPLHLESKRDEFRVGKMGSIYLDLLRECELSGVVFWNDTRYLKLLPRTSGSCVEVQRDGKSVFVNAKVVIGADGAKSKVAPDLGLKQNKKFIVGFEEVWKADDFKAAPHLHCFLDAKLAPGYLAWITNDGEEIHIGVGGYSKHFKPRKALAEFKSKTLDKMSDIPRGDLLETRGGLIPVGGIMKKISTEKGLLIGDAAGAVSPLTAGGLDPALRLTVWATTVITESLQQQDPKLLLQYTGAEFRTRFASRLWMRKAIQIFSYQPLLEMICFVLRMPLIKKLASHVFFSRSSFPDVNSVNNQQLKMSDQQLAINNER